ncbi:Response regulator receiver domain-containing protein [Lachnospiraceae bacterium XBB1006]|nr:Response regulator receiver domain-containing protein [Lachnospiraceae bacterium XBB1006]
MAEKVLVVSKGSGFMVNAILENLRKQGYEVTMTEPTMEELNLHQEDAKIYVFFLGDYLAEIAEPLVFLKDLCVEKEKQLLVIGSQDEYEELCRTIPKPVLAGWLRRPLNMEELFEKLAGCVKQNEERERKKNILLVDDDPAYLQMVKGWLEESYRVVITTSGMQAITYMATHTPDLVLLDYEMPVTTGPQILEMMRSEVKSDGIPVIFLTGKGDKESVMRVLSLKPDGYLLKTMQKKEILEAIEQFFEKEKLKEKLSI